jgi:hypothetical protein
MLITAEPQLLLRLLDSWARLAHFRRLQFGDDCYARHRLLDRIDDDSFHHGSA